MFSHAVEVESVLSPVLTLAAFMVFLALCGLLAYVYGWDSRDGFADQAHRPDHQ